MAKQGISTGTTPNDGTGDSLLSGAVKINSNFDEIYTAIGDGSTLSPVTSIVAGDNISVSGSTGNVTITGIGTADIDTDKINVSGISTFGTVQISSGIVTAKSGIVTYYGDGSGLTGVASTDYIITGTAATFNNAVKVGTAVTIDATSGIVTATSFSGSGIGLTGLPAGQLTGSLPAIDGSALTGVTAVGSGIEVRDSGTPIGAASTVDFGTGLSVSPVSSGIVTVTSSAGAADTANINSDTLIVTGISTLGVTSATDLTSENLTSEQLNVTGVSTFSGNVNFEDNALFKDLKSAYFGTHNDLRIWHQGGYSQISASTGTGSLYIEGANISNSVVIRAFNDDCIVANYDGGTEIYYDNSKKFETTGSGAIVTGILTATSFSGSNTLKERSTVSGVTASIADNGIGNTDITGYKSYALMKVGLSTDGWLRLYTDSTSRSNDSSRSVGIDPTPGSGVIAEVVTTGVSTTQIISPFVMGGNLNDPADTTIYAAVTNLSGVTTSISINLTLLQLEA